MHKSIQIANEIIERGLRQSPPVTFTPMQLLKLVYLCHGWMLGLYGRPLIADNVQAWKYGPVIPDLYHQIKSYRDSPITSKISTWWSGQDRPLDAYENAIIDQTLAMYGHMTGVQLSQITHAPATPWSMTFRPDQLGSIISDEVIRDHYQRLYHERTQGSGANPS
ncbi:Panacea domain-containing protein [Pseudomonas fulva]|uniref:Panacea domain-containing protein n=1 Tax=Pseudomonas fulva TaxID=47880 RepID=UPI003F9345DD